MKNDEGAKQAGGLVPPHDETDSAAPKEHARAASNSVWETSLAVLGAMVLIAAGIGLVLFMLGTLESGESEAEAEAETETEVASLGPAPPAVPHWRDCPHCPEMVDVPAGTFAMGSPDDEDERDEDEGPQRQMTLAAFAMGRHEVTVAQFRHFAEATGYTTDAEREPDAGCFAWDIDDEEWLWRPERSWRKPGFDQGDQHPVVCVSQNDALAYAQWLSQETGQVYRLPSEAQWEYAARAGSRTSRPWGDKLGAACRHGNVADRTRPPDGSSSWSSGHGCRDGYWFTAPVGSFAANRFGLHDMIGNAWEWTLDCYDEDVYDSAAPLDGRAHVTDSCSRSVVRGASWNSTPPRARSAYREAEPASKRDDDYGFRVIRELTR